MSNLIRHADRELKILGYTGEEPEDDPDRWMYDHIMTMVKTFAEESHSGSSASYALHVLEKLLKFENLTPLTNNPDEWTLVDAGDDPCWQNNRCSEAFSYDGGKTYYLLSEGGNSVNRQPMHKSEEKK